MKIMLVAALAPLTMLAAPVWRMAVEKDGTTNWVTAAENRWAIDVRFGADAGGWKGTIVNREPGAVVLDFEVMSDPLPVADGRTALYLPYVYGWRIRNWPREGVKLPGRRIWTEAKDGVFELTKCLKYPGKFGTMQWCTLNDGAKGFYLGSDDAKCVAKDFRAAYDSRAKEVRLGFDLPMFVPAGVTFEVPRLFFDAYEGDWKAAARRYRAWWDTCRTVARIPDRVKDTVGAMMVILKQQNGEFVWPYGDFASMGDAALAHGLHNIEMHGWGVGGHDRLYPEYDPDPSMGGRETLMKGVEALKRRGIHVTLYANGQLQQHGGTRWYDERGWMCPILKRDGTPLQEFWIKFNAVGGVHFDVACPACGLWRRQMLKNCRDAQALGYLGFFYDQIGKQWPWPCFDVRHGHRAGQYVWQDDRETLFKGILDEMRKTDPDFILWSEAFNDTLLPAVSCYQGLDYVYMDGRWAVENRFVKGVGCDMYPELTCYTFPELITCDRTTNPFCTRSRANGCAAANLRVDLEVRYPGDRWYVEKGEKPSDWEYGRVYSKTEGVAYMAEGTHWKVDRNYLKCVGDFRRRYREILLRGTFKADEGFTLSGDGDLVANRWTGTNGEEGILVWNASDRPADVKVAFGRPLVACAEPERGEVAANEPIGANTLRLYRYR